mmetsp:Transcript_57186/g.134593  ORF Transcript_57186/g.134593 Transcript_57186/m.134593 type:complete len:392 (+) Transcript_57186:129-1304(+)
MSRVRRLEGSEDGPEVLHRHPFLEGLDGEAKVGVQGWVAVEALAPVRVVGGEGVAGGLFGVDNLHVVHHLGDLEVLELRSLLLHRVLDAEDRVRAVGVVERLDFLVDKPQLLRRVHPEPQHVRPAASGSGEDEGRPELAFSHPHRLDLDVGDADVEVLREVRVPHHAHVGEEEGAQIALVGAEVPDAWDLVEDLLLGEDDELLVLDHRAAQLQLAVHFARIVGAEHRLHRCEQPRAVAHQVGENELKTAAIELGQHIERLGRAAEAGVGGADVNVDDGAVADAEVRLVVGGADPDEPKVRDAHLATLAIISFCVFYAAHAVDHELAAPQHQLLHLDVETDLLVMPLVVRLLCCRPHHPRETFPSGREACPAQLGTRESRARPSPAQQPQQL